MAKVIECLFALARVSDSKGFKPTLQNQPRAKPSELPSDPDELIAMRVMLSAIKEAPRYKGGQKVSAEIFRRKLALMGVDLKVYEPGFARYQALYRGHIARKFYKKRVREAAYREKVTREILQTERDYVNNLGVCLALYQDRMLEEINKNRGALERGDLKMIFGDFEAVLSFHKAFLSRLEESMSRSRYDIPNLFLSSSSPSSPSSSPPPSTSSSLFLGDLLHVYIPYVQKFSTVMTTVQNLRNSRERFSQFMDDCQHDPLAKGLDLASYLIMPIQRIPRYSLLLQELLKHTRPDHTEYDKLGEALTKVKDIALNLNEKKRDSENKSKLFEITAVLEGTYEPLFSQGRRHVKDAILHENKTNKQMALYLFSDILIFGKLEKKQRGGVARKVKYLGTLKIDEIDVQSIPDTLSIKHAFRITRITGAIVNLSLSAKTENEKKEWIHIITQTADDWRLLKKATASSSSSSTGAPSSTLPSSASSNTLSSSAMMTHDTTPTKPANKRHSYDYYHRHSGGSTNSTGGLASSGIDEYEDDEDPGAISPEKVLHDRAKKASRITPPGGEQQQHQHTVLELSQVFASAKQARDMIIEQMKSLEGRKQAEAIEKRSKKEKNFAREVQQKLEVALREAEAHLSSIEKKLDARIQADEEAARHPGPSRSSQQHHHDAHQPQPKKKFSTLQVPRGKVQPKSSSLPTASGTTPPSGTTITSTLSSSSTATVSPPRNDHLMFVTPSAAVTIRKPINKQQQQQASISRSSSSSLPSIPVKPSPHTPDPSSATTTTTSPSSSSSSPPSSDSKPSTTTTTTSPLSRQQSSSQDTTLPPSTDKSSTSSSRPRAATHNPPSPTLSRASTSSSPSDGSNNNGETKSTEKSTIKSKFATLTGLLGGKERRKVKRDLTANSAKASTDPGASSSLSSPDSLTLSSSSSLASSSSPSSSLISSASPASPPPIDDKKANLSCSTSPLASTDQKSSGVDPSSPATAITVAPESSSSSSSSMTEKERRRALKEEEKQRKAKAKEDKKAAATTTAAAKEKHKEHTKKGGDDASSSPLSASAKDSGAIASSP
eukprot:TRINITY_DN6041_c0_g2_i6.p1 TRINITY_DN6041_c0_g2~~TRINITY_DN6041_c0_g2_i6.p1  ORF type:complete len:1168 (-),score=332.78 TRINITY_DN6041_c0_g2_i6:54-3242(-)